MANIPLIPGAQQTYSKFRRRGKQQTIDFSEKNDEHGQSTKRSFKRSMGDRRKHHLKVRLERRSNQDRRNQHSSARSISQDKENMPDKGRHINTTA